MINRFSIYGNSALSFKIIYDEKLRETHNVKVSSDTELISLLESVMKSGWDSVEEDFDE